MEVNLSVWVFAREVKAREFLAGRPQVEVATAGLKRLESYPCSVEAVSYVVEGEARAGLISPEGIRTNPPSAGEGMGRGGSRCDTAAVSLLSLTAVPPVYPFSLPLHVCSPSHTQPPSANEIMECGGSRRGTAAAFIPLFTLLPGYHCPLPFCLCSPSYSRRVLARAWGVEEADVAQLLQGQNDAAIAKVHPGKVVSAASAADNSEATVAFGDFVYNLIEEQASIETPGGGTLSTADGFKLPVFRHLGVSAARINLLPNAMAAPHWLSNAAAIHFVTRGSGRFEIAYPDGRKALRKRVNAGDVVVVPAAFAHAVVSGAVWCSVVQCGAVWCSVVASGEGLEYIALSPKSKPKPGFLAGGNSVYSALPTAVLKAAFNVDKALVGKLRESREGEYVILSPAKGKEEGGF
ncbi:unnamed protein product [Closterium sp. Yama58-4]|nr:unnamed protein product [Closterium sp. Yama58-4]